MRCLPFLIWGIIASISDASITPAGPSLTKIQRDALLQSSPSIAANRERQWLPHKSSHLIKAPRGGATASCDSDLAIAIKTGISAAVETAALLGVIAIGKAVSPTTSKWLENLKLLSEINGLAIAQWVACFFVIFNSSFIGAFVQGSVSAATNQVIRPDVVPGDPTWYANLKRPAWEPPGWVFPIMWLIVSKPTQLLAVTRLLKSTASVVAEEATAAASTEGGTPWPVLAVYCFQLSLGDAWNKVFFGCQRVGLGVVVITTYFGVLLLAASLFSSVDVTAGKFMFPTCAWVLIATALNWSIFVKNKK